jgi:hypothetical protein
MVLSMASIFFRQFWIFIGPVPRRRDPAISAGKQKRPRPLGRSRPGSRNFVRLLTALAYLTRARSAGPLPVNGKR